MLNAVAIDQISVESKSISCILSKKTIPAVTLVVKTEFKRKV